MKLVLVFLVSILVAISPRRQSHQQRNGQLWWSKYNNEQPRQQKISLYYDPVDAKIPFFRYLNPIRMRPTVICREGVCWRCKHRRSPKRSTDDPSTLNLKKGDRVWVQIDRISPGAFLYDSGAHFTHFTGFMLEEEILASLWDIFLKYKKMIVH